MLSKIKSVLSFIAVILVLALVFGMGIATLIELNLTVIPFIVIALILTAMFTFLVKMISLEMLM